jgi:hypothetical protein
MLVINCFVPHLFYTDSVSYSFMLVINCFVPHLFYTDTVSYSFMSVAKKPGLKFAELHVRVKIGGV